MHVLKSLSYKILLINLLNAELNPICHLLALLGAHHILHVGWLRVKQISYFFRRKFLNVSHLYFNL